MSEQISNTDGQTIKSEPRNVEQDRSILSPGLNVQCFVFVTALQIMNHDVSTQLMGVVERLTKDHYQRRVCGLQFLEVTA